MCRQSAFLFAIYEYTGLNDGESLETMGGVNVYGKMSLHIFAVTFRFTLYFRPLDFPEMALDLYKHTPR